MLDILNGSMSFMYVTTLCFLVRPMPIKQSRKTVDDALTSFLVSGFVGNGYQELKTEGTVEDLERWENTQANEHQSCEHISQWNANASNPMIHVNKEALDMVSVHRHFHSLERQQLSMMEMLQVNI